MTYIGRVNAGRSNVVGEAERALATTALFTDRYELTMLAAAVRAGYAETPACFEVFTRQLPPGRRYGVVAGVDAAVEAVENFRFDDATMSWLVDQAFLDDATLDRLANYRYRGQIDAYRDGELYFANSPIMTFESSYGDVVILETIVLSLLNHSCAIAAAASRMRVAADSRTLIEMGSRRTHPNAAVAAAHAAYTAGFDATSNLAAGQRYAIPTVGTAAHASILAASTERAAFDAQIAAQGVDTTLLVDTFDITTGIRTAVQAANDSGAVGPGAIRIDSGDPDTEVPKARQLLDHLGATATRIVLTGDHDEFSLRRYRDLPVDGFGVGTALVTGSGHPAAGLVFKLVAMQDAPGGGWRDVAKQSDGKASVGGRKVAWREFGDDGRAVAERVADVDHDRGRPVGSRPLQVCVFDGQATGRGGSLYEARAHHRTVLAELHPEQLELSDGDAALIGG